MPVALTIAGSDPSGGAGIQADLKVFHQFGVYGEAVISLITVQNTRGVDRMEVLSRVLVGRQLQAVLQDIPPDAAKTGALGSAGVVRAVARLAGRFTFPLVVDPVLASTSGRSFMQDPSALYAMRDELLPRATLVTPNIPEAEALAGMKIGGPDDLRRAAERLRDRGARAVLIKGGHREGPATDVLLAGDTWHEFTAPRIASSHTHGTGCAYSAAITAGLAQGMPLVDAIARAKLFVGEAIRTAPGLGKGCGPLNLHVKCE